MSPACLWARLMAPDAQDVCKSTCWGASPASIDSTVGQVLDLETKTQCEGCPTYLYMRAVLVSLVKPALGNCFIIDTSRRHVPACRLLLMAEVLACTSAARHTTPPASSSYCCEAPASLTARLMVGREAMEPLPSLQGVAELA